MGCRKQLEADEVLLRAPISVEEQEGRILPTGQMSRDAIRLSAQGWSSASIARMLGIHKKTAVKYAQAEHFPEARSDRGHKLAPISRFYTRNGPPESTLSLLFIRLFVPRVILARKPLYATT
jgi:hypothetical protein